MLRDGLEIPNAQQSILHEPSSKMNADPFSELIQLITAKALGSGGLVAGGAWGLEIPAPDGVKFWGVAKGKCWIKLEGKTQPLLIQSGEVLLLTAPRALVIASDLEAPRTRLDDLINKRSGAVSQLGDGDDFFMIGGNISLAHAGADLFLGSLPPYLHLSKNSTTATTVHWLLEQLMKERREQRPGATAISSQLAELIFIQILRSHLEEAPSVTPGLLKAACDKRLAPALSLIHCDPSRTWRLGELAAASAMSRASFSAYFKQVAGVSALVYVTGWRMRLARKALLEERLTLSQIAPRFGYASESAFSNAFKRLTGMSPKRYRETGNSDTVDRSA